MPNRFKPKYGEEYFCIRWIGSHAISVFTYRWQDDVQNLRDLKNGNCFKTLKEASEHEYEVYERVTGRKWSDEER